MKKTQNSTVATLGNPVSSIEFVDKNSQDPARKSEVDDLEEADQYKRISRLLKSELLSILELPRPLRCEIWKRVGYKHFAELRLTCNRIRHDIDDHVGVSALLNWNHDSFEFFEDVGIRKATIINLSNPKPRDFLLHPELLVELSIHGPISSMYFKYFMKYCQNIHRLSIVFNKPMLKMKPILFPQLFSACLPKCNAIRFVSHTKLEKDLIYICDNITGLIKDTLEDDSNRRMTDILFSLMHVCPSPYLEELVLEVIVFAHKNSKTLQQFHLNVKERDMSNKAEQEAAEDEDEESGNKRRDTGALSQETNDNEPSEAVQAQHFAADNKNADIKDDAERYVDEMEWGSLPHLKKVFIAGHSRTLQYLKWMIMKSSHVSSLQLELNAGVIRNCWVDYKEIIPQICQTLTAIKLVGVSFQNRNQVAMDIDFIVFQKCIALHKLHISSIQKDVDHLSRGKNITKLPRTLKELEIGWITISAWQWFRLLCCFKNLDTIAISYATSSESNFHWLLTIIRLLINVNWTKAQLITLTDIKIKFRNKRAAVKKLEKAVPVSIEYLDLEDTQLRIDRGQSKRSQTSIPSIASE